MKERKAAPVGGLDAAAQLVPAVDLVHRLVGDDLFQHDGGGSPIHPLHHEESPVEPSNQQVAKIGLEWAQIGPLPDHVQ